MRPLTVSQAVCITVMTGMLMLDPVDFHREVEKKLGRSIHPAEFNNNEFIVELQDIYRKDFETLTDVVPDSGLILPK